jgi:hypothetical protein
MASMCLQVMQLGGVACGFLSPRRRWRVVLMEKVPHDHGGRELSFWTAILSTLMYEEGGDWKVESSCGKGIAESIA